MVTGSWNYQKDIISVLEIINKQNILQYLSADIFMLTPETTNLKQKPVKKILYFVTATSGHEIYYLSFISLCSFLGLTEQYMLGKYNIINVSCALDI